MVRDVKIKPVDASAEVSPVSLELSMINAVTTPATASFTAGTAVPEPVEAARPPPSAPVAAPPDAVVTISAEAAQRAGSLSNATKAYDPADVDQDGIVTPKEQADQDAKLAAERAAQGALGARTPEADAAVKEYAAVEQLGQLGRGPGAA